MVEAIFSSCTLAVILWILFDGLEFTIDTQALSATLKQMAEKTGLYQLHLLGK